MASPKCVGEGMQAALAWMASAVAAGRGATPDGARWAAKAAALGAGYKTAPVREAAAALFAAMASTLGGGELHAAVHSIDNKALKQTAVEALQKAGISTSGGGGGGLSTAGSAASSRPGTATGGRAPAATSNPLRASGGGAAGSRPGTAASASSARSGGSRTGGAAAVATAPSALGRGAGAGGPDEGPVLLMDNKKDDRAKKAKFRGTKFEIRPDDVQQLEIDLGALVSPSLRALLFAKVRACFITPDRSFDRRQQAPNLIFLYILTHSFIS
jgi:cytoskeleton-associated protein 5